MALFVFWRLLDYSTLIIMYRRRGKVKQITRHNLLKGIKSAVQYVFRASINHNSSSAFACDNKCRAFLAIRMDDVRKSKKCLFAFACLCAAIDYSVQI